MAVAREKATRIWRKPEMAFNTNCIEVIVESQEKNIAKTVRRYLLQHGFSVYPEHLDWDLVAVRKGVIVGIETKVKFNEKAFQQCIRRVGVHWKVVVAQRSKLDHFINGIIAKAIPVVYDNGQLLFNKAVPYRLMRHAPLNPIWIPPFQRNCEAGVSSPRKVNKQAAGALVLERLLREKPLSKDEIHSLMPEYSEWIPRYLVEFCYMGDDNLYRLFPGEAAPPSRRRKFFLKAGINQADAGEVTGNLSDGAAIVKLLRMKAK